jgi:hypothetical protein
MSKRVKILIAVAMVLTLAAVSGQAIKLGGIVKVAGIGFVVDKFGNQINSFVNKLTFNKDLGTTDTTKVVPILTIGSGGYVGAAQVIGTKANVDKCQAVVQIEGNAVFGSKIRAKALVPVNAKSVKDIKRVQGVGISAIIDVKI